MALGAKVYTMRMLQPFLQLRPSTLHSPLRSFTTTSKWAESSQGSYPNSQAPREKPVNFYRTHGRAFAKVLTLAFLTYQISYWVWLMLETEQIKDKKNREIRSLEQEVRLLDEGRKSHKPGG